MAIIAYTLSGMRTDARRMLQERTAERFLDTDFDRWANEGSMVVAAMTRCLRTTTADSTSATQAAYAMPTAALGSWAISRVEVSGVEMHKAPFAERKQYIKAHFPGLDPDTAGSPRAWSPYGQKFYLTPKPSASGSDDIDVWFAQVPETMTADAVAFQLPVIFAPAVRTYMVYMGLFLKGDRQGALQMYQQFLQSVAMVSQKGMPDASARADSGAG